MSLTSRDNALLPGRKDVHQVILTARLRTRQIIRRGRPMELIAAHDYESAIGRPCHACQGPKISSIAVYKPGGPTVNLGDMNIRDPDTHCSAKASITRKQPSSEIAATYLTSGENTKSAEVNPQPLNSTIDRDTYRRRSVSTPSSDSPDSS